MCWRNIKIKENKTNVEGTIAWSFSCFLQNEKQKQEIEATKTRDKF
jgi:hypothetical protein